MRAAPCRTERLGRTEPSDDELDGKAPQSRGAPIPLAGLLAIADASAPRQPAPPSLMVAPARDPQSAPRPATGAAPRSWLGLVRSHRLTPSDLQGMNHR